MKLFFLPTVSAGFQSGELGEIHFGLGTTPVTWCENVWKRKNCSYKISWCCTSNRLFVSSWCKNAGQNLRHISTQTFTFPHFCDIQILHFRTFNCCNGKNHVTKSLKRSYMFGKCVGKCVGFGQCLHKRGCNGRFLGAAQSVVKWCENMGENEKFT